MELIGKYWERAVPKNVQEQLKTASEKFETGLMGYLQTAIEIQDMRAKDHMNLIYAVFIGAILTVLDMAPVKARWMILRKVVEALKIKEDWGNRNGSG